MSAGCGKTPTLKTGSLTVQSGGASRKYMLRLPDGYDNKKPYRLILGFHGANGSATEVAGAQNNAYFGLYALAAGSTIFIATEAVGGLWSAATDATYVDEVLKQVLPDLCVDTTRIELEGFSQGAAMVWTLACSKPNVFRAAIGHSGGGVTAPTTCQPVAYMGSLGLQESMGGGQAGQTDKFGKWNGCTIETLPTAPTGGHVCSDYKGCSTGHPVRWCSFDGGHSPAPKDSGQSATWMPKEAWAFLSQF
jgi:poly(3-hydroxybutyrate) depolymerase